jgi:hypothetical protein
MVWQLTQSPETALHAEPASKIAANMAVTASKSEVFLFRFFICVIASLNSLGDKGAGKLHPPPGE